MHGVNARRECAHGAPTRYSRVPPSRRHLEARGRRVTATHPGRNQVYAADEAKLSADFGAAFKKLTELGCPWAAQGGAQGAAGRSCPHHAGLSLAV